MPPPAVSLDGEGPTLATQEGGGSVSLQADWACAWIRVVGAVDRSSIPRVLRGVQMACQARPRKLRLLLREATCSPEALEELLPAATSFAEAYGVKLVAQTSTPRDPGWYRKVAWWRSAGTDRGQVQAVA